MKNKNLELRKKRLIERLLEKKFPRIYSKDNYYDYFKEYKQWLKDNPKERQKAEDTIKIKERLEKEDYLKEYKIEKENNN